MKSAPPCEGVRRPLGNHRLSYMDITRAYFTINDPTRYNLVSNNCQTWARGLLRLLHIPCPEEMNEMEDVVGTHYSLPSTSSSETNCYVNTGFEQPIPRNRCHVSPAQSQLYSCQDQEM
ncbi:hypothetical protein MTO96_030236, partial [Rhipicephalus appendiculatus]